MKDRFDRAITLGDEIVYAVKKSTWVNLKHAVVMECAEDQIKVLPSGDVKIRTLKTPSNIVSLTAWLFQF